VGLARLTRVIEVKPVVHNGRAIMLAEGRRLRSAIVRAHRSAVQGGRRASLIAAMANWGDPRREIAACLVNTTVRTASSASAARYLASNLRPYLLNAGFSRSVHLER